MTKMRGVIITRYMFLLSLLFASSVGFAQPNTLIVGKINNRISLEKEIELHLNVRYLTSDIEVYSSNILEDGTFAFGVDVREPQYASLRYSQEKKLIYLEPNDTLFLEINGGSFPLQIEFGGRSGANNRYLTKYLMNNPKELDQFKKVQFRKGIFWYNTLPDQDKMMRNTTPERYKAKFLLKKEQAYASLDAYKNNHTGELTSEFSRFLDTEIMYQWAYNMLMFGHLYKGRYDLPDSYFGFMDEVPVSGGSIGNHYYRDYLMAYLNYKDEKSGKKDNLYVAQYDLATSLLTEQSQAFVQSEMLYKAFSDKKPEEMLGRYWAFIDNTEYLGYEEKVNFAYQNAMRYAEGVAAPDFSIEDIEGNTIQLAQYNGKVVYLNFWASWCRPCMKKMDRLRPMVNELELQGIVFLNISLDRSKEDWERAVAAMNFGGVHAMVEGDIDSDLAKKYEIKILPQYYIIDKYGGFAKRPEKNDLAGIKTTLTALAR